MVVRLTMALLLFSCSNAAFSEALGEADSDFNRWFIGVDVGKTEHRVSVNGRFDDLFDDVSEKGSGIGISAGYWFNENVAIKLGQQDFGDVHLSDFDISAPPLLLRHTGEGSATTLTAVFSTPQGNNPWRGFAEIGLASWKYDWEILVTDGVNSVTLDVLSDKGVGISGSLGGAYDMTPRLEVVLAGQWLVFEADYDEVGVILFETSSADLQMSRFSLGLNYSF